MAKFGSLWVGDPLTKLQMTALASFVYHKHDITLFVYDPNLEVPAGVIKQDARLIMPEESIFQVKNQFAAFSDLFRYQMIYKTGLSWVDADTICLTSDWDMKDNTYAGFERDMVVGGVLSLPQDSLALRYLIKASTKFDKTKINWIDVGPALVDKVFRKYSLMDYVYSEKTFCGIHWSEWEKLWSPKHIKEIKKLEQTGKSISIYNSMVTISGRDKNDFPKGSAMEYFYDKFINKRWG